MPDEIEKLLALGRMDLEAGYPEYAREYFEKVLVLDATNQEAIDGLAQVDEILSRRRAAVVTPAGDEQAELPRKAVVGKQSIQGISSAVLVGIIAVSVFLVTGLMSMGLEKMLLVIVALVSIAGPICILFVVHLRPLTEEEIKQLATKRRSKAIRRYFLFTKKKFSVDKEFKGRMDPKGRFYRISKSLSEFPSIAAALLKWKKHEWIIFAFEKQQRIDLVWLNKGVDRSRVSPYLSMERIAEIAKQENYESLLVFHNHPNPNPSYYDCSRPSSPDIKSANERARVLNRKGINLVEFICERGEHYQYYLSPADSFLPLSEFIIAINRVNGLSKLKNLSLHFERIF